MMDNVHVVLDMKGLSCPKPLIGAKRMVDELTSSNDGPRHTVVLVLHLKGAADGHDAV